MTAFLLFVALHSHTQAVTLDVSDNSTFTHLEDVEVRSGRLILQSRTGEWTELFKGKPAFGHITGVFSYGEKLFFFDSPLPAGNDGGDIFSWDFKSNKPRKVGQVQEQGVIYMRQNGKNLYIPGPDATEAWELGNFYRSSDMGEKWSKVRTIPKGVHIWDLCHWRGKMYVSTGSVNKGEGYGAVLESSDDGKTWKETLAAYPPDRKKQFARCYALIPLADALYASWTVVDNDTAKPGPRPANDFYKFDGRKWSPVTLFTTPPRTPYFGLRHKEIRDFSLVGARGNSFLLKDGVVQSLKGLEGLTTFDFTALGEKEVLAVATDAQTKESALYAASISPLGDRIGAFQKTTPLPPAHEGLSLAALAGRVYVGAKAEGGGRLLTEAGGSEGYAYSRAIRIQNRNRIRIRWEGFQPLGSSIQFQVHAARSEREVLRMSVWPETLSSPSAQPLELKGLPKGQIWIQLRVVMRTTNSGAQPELQRMSVDSL